MYIYDIVLFCRFQIHFADMSFLEEVSRTLTSTQVKIKSEVATSNTQSREQFDLINKIRKMITEAQKQVWNSLCILLHTYMHTCLYIHVQLHDIVNVRAHTHRTIHPPPSYQSCHLSSKFSNHEQIISTVMHTNSGEQGSEVIQMLHPLHLISLPKYKDRYQPSTSLRVFSGGCSTQWVIHMNHMYTHTQSL